jgi:type VI secretion system protein ImpF
VTELQPGSARAAASVLDRLLDGQPEKPTDRKLSASATVAELRRAVRRDVEALLNARRPWHSVPDRFATLRTSPLGYGIADFTAGAFDDEQQQEALRIEIETAIRRFEPRLARVQVELANPPSPFSATLTLRVSALLQMQPESEQVDFDTIIDRTTADVMLRASGDI